MTDETELPQWEIDFLNEQAARDAVVQAAIAFRDGMRTRFDGDAYAALRAAVDRLAGTGPPAAPESPPAAEQATPAPQDTTGPNLLELAKARGRAMAHVPSGPAGLSAEQEIRVRAAHLWIAAEYTTWKLGDWCAWIRDGRTPDEASGPGFADPGGPWKEPSDA